MKTRKVKEQDLDRVTVLIAKPTNSPPSTTITTCPKCGRVGIEPTEIEWRNAPPVPPWHGFKIICSDCWYQSEALNSVEDAMEDFLSNTTSR